MACKSICRMCDRLVVSESVTADGTNLVINIPDGIYLNGEKYCIVIAQAIPDTATINLPVVITIGDGTTLFPLLDESYGIIVASQLRSRTKYSTRVVTNATDGVFKLIGKLCGADSNDLPALTSEV